MAAQDEPVIRVARVDDVEAICRFGETHVQAHYEPLIGARAAADQVHRWWDERSVAPAVAAGTVLVAEVLEGLVGVAQYGASSADHVVYKLYVDPRHRGAGLGPRLIAAVTARLPAGTDRLHIEHFAANQRAGAFYAREGFVVERVEPSPTGDRRLDVVWRARDLHAAPTDRTKPADGDAAR